MLIGVVFLVGLRNDQVWLTKKVMNFVTTGPGVEGVAPPSTVPVTVPAPETPPPDVLTSTPATAKGRGFMRPLVNARQILRGTHDEDMLTQSKLGQSKSGMLGCP